MSKIENKNLKNNSVIKIVVWAEDKSVSTYQIKILKENKINGWSFIFPWSLSICQIRFR